MIRRFFMWYHRWRMKRAFMAQYKKTLQTYRDVAAAEHADVNDPEFTKSFARRFWHKDTK